ncbi:MAG: hypothetical protein Q9174_003840 [Haloplaca sp. 1 TL-2023]
MLTKPLIAFLAANVWLAQAAPTSESDITALNVRVPAVLALNASLDDDWPCGGYSRCGEKGAAYWQGLLKKVRSLNPEDKEDGLWPYRLYYRSIPVDRKATGHEVAKDLIARGLSPLDEYEKWVSVPRRYRDGPPNESEEDAEDWPYQNMFHAQDGNIIATSNWRAQDIQKKLQWSELVFQTYKAILEPGQKASGLRSVIQVDVTNTATFRIVKGIYDSQSIDFFTDMEWRRWTIGQHTKSFYALLGLDNIKGTVWLLRDHAGEIGKKVITGIWTRTQPTFDIWIDLGPYDPRRDDSVASFRSSE